MTATTTIDETWVREPDCDGPGCDDDPGDMPVPQIVQQVALVREDRPLPLDATPAPPAFPVDVLPGVLCDYVCAVSEDIQVDPCMPAIVSIASIASIALGHVDVELTSTWTEPTALNLGIVAGTGERKSPVVNTITRPIRMVEDARHGAWQPRHDAALIDLKVLREQQGRAWTEVKRKPHDPDVRAEAESIETAVTEAERNLPREPRLISDDVTPESLAVVLERHGEATSIISPEAGILSTIAGRYNSGVANYDLFLKAWSGEPIRIDRKTTNQRAGERIHLRRPLLVMCLMMQPGVAEDLLADAEAADRGFAARFLMAVADNKVGARKINPIPLPTVLSTAWNDLIATLADRLTGQVTLTLSDEARWRFDHYRETLEARLTGDYASAIGWFNKAPGQVIRLAAILHLVSNIDAVVIDASTLRAAIALIDYFAANTLILARQTSPEVKAARTALAWIRSNKRPGSTFTFRDLHQAHRAYGSASDYAEVVDLLVDKGWIRQIPVDTTGRPGRPPSPTFRAHPDTWEVR